MAIWGQLLLLMLQNLFSLLTNVMFWVILLIIGMQYRKMRRISQNLFQLPDEPVWPVVLVMALYGLLGGFLGSILILLVGVSVLEVGLVYLWLTALALMLIRQRFLCFSYAGGVVAVANLLFGFPQVSVPHVMGLVAILHLVEAMLIFFTGPLYPEPVYLKTDRGQVVGGYNLQKFWPLPLVALVAWYIPNSEILTETLKMPEWWPLIKTKLTEGQGELVYAMAPVLAALGYGDIAISQEPREKTRRSAWELAGYSLILLLLSILADRFPAVSFLPALFGPLGHEALIIMGRKREMGREPIYVPPTEGIKVLYVLRKSALEKIGVRNGDVILRLNGQECNAYTNLTALLWEAGETVEVEFLSGPEQVRKKGIIQRGLMEPLGFIPVPRGEWDAHLIFSGSASPLVLWLKRIFRRKSK